MTVAHCKYVFLFLLALLATINPCLAGAHVISEPASNASVTVYCQHNQKPLTDAIVKIVPLLENERAGNEIAVFTNESGLAKYMFTRPVIIQVSYVGYATVTDTLTKLENRIYFLQQNQNLQDVVVTGQHAPGSAQKSVYEVKVISQEELKAKGATNLREALQTKLNIDLGQDPVFGSSISINGISGEGIKIMVDGVPVIGRLDGKLDLSQINLNNIDHIEIVEGPLSVIYGTDALGGVINIITKTFQAEKVNVNLRGYYETAGQYNVQVNTGFAFKKHQLYLSAGRNFFDGFNSVDSGQRSQEWKPKEQYFADAKYVVSDTKYRLSLSGSFFRELMLNRGNPQLTLSDVSATGWTYRGIDDHILTYRPRATVSFAYTLKQDSRVDVLLGYSGWFRFLNKYAKDLVTGKESLAANADQDTGRYNHIVARSTYTLPAWKNRLVFLFGIDVNQEFVTQTRIAGQTKKLGDYAAFGSARLTIIEGLDVQPAIRFAYNTLFKTPLIPSLNLRYNWNDKLVFRASYGRGYRSPGVKELYLDFVIDAHTIKGNPDLKPEDGHNVNSSLSYNLRIKKHLLTFSANGFFNYIFNKIDLVNVGIGTGSTPVYQYFNFNRQSTYGAGAGINYRWARLQASVMAQYTGYEIIYKTTGAQQVKMWSPDVTLSASYLIPTAEIGVNVSYKFNGVKPLYLAGSQFQAGSRNAYHLMDVSLMRNFWKDRIQLTVGAKNLLGVKNVAINGEVVVGHSDGKYVNVGWGQTFFTSLVLHFSK
jgi:outer membrane receptor for ferrienterochelin and colicins